MRSKRRAGLAQLERPHDAATIVLVKPCRRARVTLNQSRIGALGTEPIVDPLPVLTAPRCGCGRQRELGERGTEVQARAPGDDGNASRCQNLVDSCMREPRVRG